MVGMMKEAILRINEMESIYDKVLCALDAQAEELSSAKMQDKIKTLYDYYTSGDWLRDYELDERGLLPPEMKRGVLSQDGLHELLSAVNEIKHK